MQYLGLQTQIWRNNLKSTLLLLLFPALMLSLLWAFWFFSVDDFTASYSLVNDRYDVMGEAASEDLVANPIEGYEIDERRLEMVNNEFLFSFPWVAALVLLWFTIAYYSHASIINGATGAVPLSRKQNPKVYNLVENLCISQGMKTPKIQIIKDSSLNAFASGLNESNYTITLSEGIIKKLDDKELEAVIAHELTHIQNKDVRLLIISIIFVGIFAFLSEMAFRILVRSRGGGDKKDGKIIIIGLFIALVGYLFSVLFRFALSRKREFLADAGSAQMTKNPQALVSALKKISQDPRIEAVERKDVAQMFIENPQEKKKSFFSSVTSLFATHPPIEDRIKVLEQF